MNALLPEIAQGAPGLALVLGLLLLHVRGGIAMAWVLLGQSALVSLAAAAASRPELAAGPLLVGAAAWAVRQRSATLGRSAPSVGPRVGLPVGVALVVLCQSQGMLAQPLGLLLLAVLLAATRPQAPTQMMALVSLQNGITLAACRLEHGLALPLLCLPLPLPLLAALGLGHPQPAWRLVQRRHARWCGWARFVASAGVFLATLLVPLDPLAAVFAPLFAFEALLRAWVERRRLPAAPVGHVASLLRALGILLAVGAPEQTIGWLGIVLAAAACFWPVLERRRAEAAVTFCALGLALLGMLALRLGAPPIGFLCLFLGLAVVAAALPDLAAPLVVMVLRLSTTPMWVPAADGMAAGAALGGLLLCALLLARHGRHRLALLHLAQTAVALLAVGLDQPDGRFAALVLLILLTLTRAASRFPASPATRIARAGLAGIPPLGVFPGLILVTLSLSAHAPWLLLPLGLALLPMVPAGLARPVGNGGPGRPSLAWVPLALASGFGFFTPDALVQWLHRLTLGPS